MRFFFHCVTSRPVYFLRLSVFGAAEWWWLLSKRTFIFAHFIVFTRLHFLSYFSQSYFWCICVLDIPSHFFSSKFFVYFFFVSIEEKFNCNLVDIVRSACVCMCIFFRKLNAIFGEAENRHEIVKKRGKRNENC